MILCMYVYAHGTLTIPEWFHGFLDSEFMIYDMPTAELLPNQIMMEM